jgi:hypothetical protein
LAPLLAACSTGAEELKGLVLTDLHVGQGPIPRSGSKDKMVPVFLKK